MFISMQSRHTNSIFDCICATIGKEDFAEMFASKFDNSLCCFVASII